MGRRRRRRRKNNIVPYIIFIIAVAFYIYALYNDDSYSNRNIVTTDLQVYFIDVGQADCILISNNGHHMLIDAGNNEDGTKLVKYIKNDLGITSFEYVVGTHPHEDHIGGLDDIINNFDIENIYLPNVTTNTETFKSVLLAIKKKGIGFETPEIGDKFKLGEADFEVMYTGTDSTDLNNTSIVLKMIFGDYSYLFTGDAADKVEEYLLDKNIDVDILKVGHHGSLYSTTDKFLARVTPEYAFISVAKENSYGHPGAATLKRIKKYTDKIYMTSELGTILLTSDGKEINIDNFKTDTNG